MSETDTSTNTTITEVNISKDQLETIQRILGSSFLLSIKRDRILAKTGLKSRLCCICGGISSPLYEVRTTGDGYVKVQAYCSTHIEKFEDGKNKTSEELAEAYGLQLVGEVPPTIREPWD